MAEQILASEHRFRGRVLNLRLDTVRLPAGKTFVREVIEHAAAVAIVPLNEKGEVYLVRQHRAGPGATLLEIPAGTVEAGEEPEACARREIQEEIGQAAGRWDLLGKFYLAPGYSTELMYLYLARDLSESRLPPDEDEDLQVEQASLDAILARTLSGEPSDMKTLAALLLVKDRLKKESGGITE